MNTALLVTLLLVQISTWVALGLALRRLRGGADGNLDHVLREELRLAREEASRDARALREEVQTSQSAANDAQDRRAAETVKAIRELTEANRKELDSQRDRILSQLQTHVASNQAHFDHVNRTLNETLRLMMEDQKREVEAVIAALKGLEKTHQEEQQKSQDRLDQKFDQIQKGNEAKLEEMRRTVDEKLHDTLEKRLGESFKLVSERLEAVQRGLGEMQTLATDVGGLKRVLTNVKERGTWGEYQLGAILEQVLTPEQFARNFRIGEGGETVEFAVKLPGKGGCAEAVWLPIDAKFPKEDYERLQAASEAADKEAVEVSTTALLRQIEAMARDIHDKYVHPPTTTDFGILFLPTEGLYAEILRRPGFQDGIQQRFRVLIAGPTILSAILSSLRVGFQTLAIEKRAHEVWTVLGAVKTEFRKFGEVLDKVKGHLTHASNTIDSTAVRTRAMERRLKSVEHLPEDESTALLGLERPDPHVDTDESAA